MVLFSPSLAEATTGEVRLNPVVNSYPVNGRAGNENGALGKGR
jgi:hypothetical protein